MKGIILAGGKGTRLYPLTKITSKQLLPVYNKPMIFYPIETLVSAGIKDILIIVAPTHAGHFLNLLGTGREFGAKFTYEIQEEARGLADAFVIGENFIGKSSVALILGDNIFDYDFRSAIRTFNSGARIAVRKVEDPKRYGVVEFDEENKVISMEEKPEKPKSNYASLGFYIYDNKVVEFAKSLTPSKRGEIEITSFKKSPAINNMYLERGELEAVVIDGFFEDAGTFGSLLRASNFMAEKALLAEENTV
jgi:glucose-1-phosphate thymidylyltransferase